MSSRTRTTKKLAERIDSNYFKRLYPIPRWRRILWIGFLAVGLAWLLWGRERRYSAGPLGHAHTVLGQYCDSCHLRGAGFRKRVTDRACLACHDGPIHQATQIFTPACKDCHVEHLGSFRLAATSDESCTQCHADLKTRSGTTAVARKVTSFQRDHPEFNPDPDPGTVRLNHQVHMRRDLRGPHGPAQLTCVDCHVSEGAYMAPVDYQRHCAECHPLTFDARFTEPVPHKKPDILRDYLTKQYTEYIALHPEEVDAKIAPDQRIVRAPMGPARSPAEWVTRRVEDAEEFLWRGRCKWCHVGPNPREILPAAIPARWLKHAQFNHDTHRMIGCVECHPRARTSRETEDVLLPEIGVCRSCHSSGADSAESGCFECHVYHDRSRERKVPAARGENQPAITQTVPP